MAEHQRDPGGGRLNRSQTVTVRLDPRLNYLCDLAARTQRRTKSSFIEAVIDEAINKIPIDPRTRGDYVSTIGDQADQLWNVRPHERLISLAQLAPHLMTMEEQEIWALILESGFFWTGRWIDRGVGEEEWTWDSETSTLLHDRVAEQWEELLAVSEGKKTINESKQLGKIRRARKKIDLDDEIPF